MGYKEKYILRAHPIRNHTAQSHEHAFYNSLTNVYSFIERSPSSTDTAPPVEMLHICALSVDRFIQVWKPPTRRARFQRPNQRQRPAL
jgi:hypothetical protein